MKAFRALVESSIATGTLDGVEALLADDVVFRSPVAFTPYPGKAITAAILDGVARVFTDFRYVSTIEEGNRSALVFEAMVGEVSVNGCDFITTNEEGLISELTVMVRPMSGATALMEAMAVQFPRIQADALAAADSSRPDLLRDEGDLAHASRSEPRAPEAVALDEGGNGPLTQEAPESLRP